MNPRRPPQAYLIYDGAEPLTFTNVFPRWERSPGPHTQVDVPCSYVIRLSWRKCARYEVFKGVAYRKQKKDMGSITLT